MTRTIKRSLPVAGLILLSAVAIGAYLLWQNLAQLDKTFGGIGFSPEPIAGPFDNADGAGDEILQPRDSDRPPSNPGGSVAGDPDALPDLNQAISTLREELAVALRDDPELLASLEEMLEEPDEELLRVNLDLLREAFLEDL